VTKRDVVVTTTTTGAEILSSITVPLAASPPAPTGMTTIVEHPLISSSESLDKLKQTFDEVSNGAVQFHSESICGISTSLVRERRGGLGKLLLPNSTCMIETTMVS
jgi:hypothetical protein